MSRVRLHFSLAYTCLATTDRATEYFHFPGGWQVQSLEADLRTPLPQTLTFTDPDKIRELARRCVAWGDSESPANAGARH
jgi:hypothetical protein